MATRLEFRRVLVRAAADWSTRPLPESCLTYAALDVELLLELRDALAEELSAAGKSEWARQEFDAILADGGRPRPRPEPWRRTSGLHHVRGRRPLAIVRSLWQASDKLPRTRDLRPGPRRPHPRHRTGTCAAGRGYHRCGVVAAHIRRRGDGTTDLSRPRATPRGRSLVPRHRTCRRTTGERPADTHGSHRRTPPGPNLAHPSARGRCAIAVRPERARRDHRGDRRSGGECVGARSDAPAGVAAARPAGYRVRRGSTRGPGRPALATCPRQRPPRRGPLVGR